MTLILIFDTREVKLSKSSKCYSMLGHASSGPPRPDSHDTRHNILTPPPTPPPPTPPPPQGWRSFWRPGGRSASTSPRPRRPERKTAARTPPPPAAAAQEASGPGPTRRWRRWSRPSKPARCRLLTEPGETRVRPNRQARQPGTGGELEPVASSRTIPTSRTSVSESD